MSQCIVPHAIDADYAKTDTCCVFAGSSVLPPGPVDGGKETMLMSPF